jgi:hypothetical protein
MRSGATPAFVLARVCAPAAQAWLPVSGSSSLGARLPAADVTRRPTAGHVVSADLVAAFGEDQSSDA